jgi:hypothetical protein
MKKYNKHKKKCSISLAIREMQIKTILRFHLTLVRMAIINKQAIINVGKKVGKGTLIHCWWECKLGQSL